MDEIQGLWRILSSVGIARAPSRRAISCVARMLLHIVGLDNWEHDVVLA